MYQPYLIYSNNAIRELAKKSSQDKRVLSMLSGELKRRKSRLAKEVLGEVESMLAKLGDDPKCQIHEDSLNDEIGVMLERLSKGSKLRKNQPRLFKETVNVCSFSPTMDEEIKESEQLDAEGEAQARAAELRIKELRSRLLETSSRNKLLNFKHTVRGAGFLRVVNESFLSAFSHIRRDHSYVEFAALPDLPDVPEDEKTLEFQEALDEAMLTDRAYLSEIAKIESSDLDDAGSRQEKAERALRDKLRKKLKMPTRRSVQVSLREHAKQHGISSDFDLELGLVQHSHRASVRWQSLQLEDDLRRRLKSIERASKEAQNELGIETLNLIFGFLEWTPKTSAGEKKDVLFSPLVLQPVSMERCKPRGRKPAGSLKQIDDRSQESKRTKEYYRITAADSDAAHANLTLRERLREDFGIVLPDIDPEEPNIEAYLRGVEAAVADQSGWKVRRFITLSNLSFSRLPMWLDLDPCSSDGQSPHRHPILRELFGGRTDRDSREVEEGWNTSKGPNPEIVLDCDSSQYAAIKAVLSGRNLVIQGPPGTGKSQTIANLIAASMGQGKSVLFVAEKQVALSVVQSRLEKVGLGDFLLELHSAKAGKAQVLESLRKRLRRRTRYVRNEDEQAAIVRKERLKVESELNDYIEIVNTEYGSTGLSLHHILWKDIDGRSESLPRDLELFELVGCSRWDQRAFSKKRDLLVQWAEVEDLISKEPSPHPWHWVTNTDIHMHEQQTILHGVFESVEKVRLLCSMIEQHHLCDLESMSWNSIKEIVDTCRGVGLRDMDISEEGWCFVRDSDPVRVLSKMDDLLARFQSANEEIVRSAPNATEEPLVLLKEIRTILSSFENVHCDSGLLWEPEGLTKEFEDLKACSAKLQNTKEKLHNLCSFSSLESAIGPDPAIDLLVSLLEMALSRPDFLKGKHVRFSDTESIERLLDAVSIISRLSEERFLKESRLHTTLSDLNLDEVQFAIYELEHSWSGSFLVSSKYRKARRYLNSIFKDVSKDEAVSFLKDCLKLIDEIEAFEKHEVASHVGSLFVGLDTNVSHLQETIRWCKEIVDQTPLTETRALEMRKCILDLDDDLHSGLEILSSGGTIEVLRKLKLRYGDSVETLAETDQVLQEELSALSVVTHCLHAWQWKGGFNRNRAGLFESALVRLVETQELIDELEKSTPFSRQEIDEVRTRLLDLNRAFSVIGGAKFSDKWKKRLFTYEDRDAWTDFQSASIALGRAVERVSDSVSYWAGVAGVSSEQIESWRNAPLATLIEVLSYGLENESALRTRCRQCFMRAAVEQEGLADFVNKVSLIKDRNLVGELFEKLFYRNLTRMAFSDTSHLKRFRRMSPSKLRNEFRRLDKELIERERDVLASRLCRREVPQGVSVGRVSELTELSLIRDMCGKERPRTPVRELLRRSGRALKALKPCFMMSPLSVAQLINRRELNFDLVIFDEASQIRPEDALSAMMRGKQFVVVGDSMQLPPTSFGERKRTGGSIDDDEDENEEDTAESVDSILELAAGTYGDGPMLMWHYRSRDPNLISFSNQEFYKNGLQVFPAPRVMAANSGISYMSVSGVYSARTNLIEAKKCAQAVRDYIRAYPDRSIGIVALNRPQADLINLEIERSLSSDEVVQDYLEVWEGRQEGLFVKNLESVQGDERDVIFISTVFGPDGSGAFFQRFGPINSPVGHRRLNVLFTRAKHHVVVITSIPIEKIQTKEGGHWGVRALKGYLEYARSGRLHQPGESHGPTESPFEDSVLRALTATGYQCKTQVGVRGFLIDLAVCNPSNPDDFILGVECDGASYHSSKSARDRDRLRQDVLEGLGWHIHRIWSTDWFRDQANEMAKLVAHIAERVQETKADTKNSVRPFRLIANGEPGGELNFESEKVSSPLLDADCEKRNCRLLFEQEMKDIKDPKLRNLMEEAFDVQCYEASEIEVPIHIEGVMGAARVEESYNQGVYLWLQAHRTVPLALIPWPKLSDLYQRVILRMNAVRDVVARLR